MTGACQGSSSGAACGRECVSVRVSLALSVLPSTRGMTHGGHTQPLEDQEWPGRAKPGEDGWRRTLPPPPRAESLLYLLRLLNPRPARSTGGGGGRPGLLAGGPCLYPQDGVPGSPTHTEGQ